jgi:hypothetical protein
MTSRIKVPEKTIAVFLRDGLSKDRLPNILEKPEKTRDWFSTQFYRCLPLTIGNQYGFVIKSEFEFSVRWTGGLEPLDTKIQYPKNYDSLYPEISSHFGSGVISINPPFFIRTPPNVNIMTFNPPNFTLPNVTVMTGVVETDNLRRNFTFNLKLQMPNIEVTFPAGTPLAAFIPIPRYFGDDFELKLATDLFSDELVAEEQEAAFAADKKRHTVEKNLKFQIGRDYYQGYDVYGNKFLDHQKPTKGE